MTLVAQLLEICKAYLEPYLIAGVAGMALLRSFTWFSDRRWRAEQDLWDKALRRPGEVKPWRVTALTWLKNASLLLFVLLFWPVLVPAILIDNLRSHIKRKDPDPADQFDCKLNSLRRRITPEIAEAESMVTDPKGRMPTLPFGHLYDGWRRFLDKSEPGFELWTFTVEGEEPYRPADVPWIQRDGRKKGLVWVCDGEVKAEFLTEWG